VGEDDEMFMTRSLNVTPKTSGHLKFDAVTQKASKARHRKCREGMGMRRGYPPPSRPGPGRVVSYRNGVRDGTSAENVFSVL